MEENPACNYRLKFCRSIDNSCHNEYRHGFVETRMYWPVTHMVAPAEMALSCEACHTVGGRLEGLAGVYIPGRDRHPLIEGLGWLAVFFTLLGVLGNGLMRAVMAMHRRRPQPAASAGDET